MSTYVVSYDLSRPGQGYAELGDYLKEHSNWWHHLGSTWVIVTELSAVQLRDGIRAHVDDNDKLLVVKSAGVGAWRGFNDKGSSWLQEHL